MEDFVVGVMQVPAGDLERLGELGDEISEEARLVVLPEFSNALPGEPGGVNAGEWVDALTALAEEHGIFVVAGVLLEEDGCRYSAVGVAGPDGSWRVVYRKALLFRALGVDESRVLCAGREPPPVLDLGFVRLGVLVCYEMRFPEFARSLALRGAEVVVAPSAWYPGALKEEHFLLCARCRALENTVWFVAVNQPGPRFTGRSVVVSPWGVPRLQLGVGPGYGEVRVSAGLLREAREKLPVLRDSVEASRLLGFQLPAEHGEPG